MNRFFAVIVAASLFAATAPAFADRYGQQSGSRGPGRGMIARGVRKIGAAVVAGTLLVGAGGYAITKSNTFTVQHEQVQTARSQIDVATQAAHDLLPNLVKATKAILGQNDIFVRVAEARAGVTRAKNGTPAEKMAAAEQLHVAIQPLLTLQESYPQLQGNEQVSELMRQLKASSDIIKVERTRYNDAANAYNTGIKLFPGSVVAGFRGLQPEPYFKAAPGATEMPKIDF